MKQSLVLLLLISLFPILVHAQGVGSMVGTVTDPSGSVVVGATVKVTDRGTGFVRSTLTNGEGSYVLSAMKPTQYDISVEAAGFRIFIQRGITLLANQTLTVNARLSLGSNAEVVEVKVDVAPIDTATSTLKHVVETERLVELPLEGRNAASLTLEATGAVSAPSGGADQGTTKTFPGAVTIAVNGSRQNQISYRLDGGNYVDEYTNVNQPFPMPDALQEFSVQTSNYSAEFGQNAGAVVNVVTRSGTNAFHGNAFEFVRNSVFNATQFQSTTGKDKIKRNQFGGTFGGPIVREKTFFFAGFQATRFRNLGDNQTKSVPTAAQRATATDPAVIALLAGIPVGDASGQVNFAKPDHQDFTDVIAKVDHALTANDRMTVRYSYDRFTKQAIFDPQNFLTYSDGSTIVGQNALIDETHVFGPSLVNSFRFNYSRENATRGPAANAISVADLGVALPFQPIEAIQQIRINGSFNFGDNPSASFIRNNFTWADDMSWSKGKHDLHFGGVIERSRVDLNNRFFQPAEFSFSSLTNFLAGQLSSYGGNPAFRQGAGEFKNNRNIFAGVYFQDNLRVNRRLTLNLGLRWEPGLPWRELKNRWTQFRIPALIAGQQSSVYSNAPAGLFFPGDSNFPTNGLRSSLNNFAPRLGFALDVFGDGKTSLRGGAGIFYDTRISGIVNNRFVDSSPFSPQLIFNTGDVNPGTFSDPLCTQAATQALQSCTDQSGNYPFPFVFPPAPDSAFRLGDLYLTWDPNHKFQVPTIYNWNLLIEHELPARFLARIGYVGSRSNHLVETLNLDPFPVGGGPLRRLNIIASGLSPAPAQPVFGDLQQVNYDVNSSYHSLQAALERRAHGLTIIGSYTYSRSIDNVPPGQGVFGYDSTYSARPWDDPLRTQFDNGPSEFDHTHRFGGSYVLQLPRWKGANRAVGNMVNGWQFSGVVSAQTGRPITVLSGQNNSGTGLGQDRPNLVGNPYGQGACAGVTAPCRSWLNPASFVANPAGTFGNVGKGSLRYPGLFTWDMGLNKDFSITERVRLQFRAEFFNVFNRVNFDESDVAGTGNFLKRNSTHNFGALKKAYDPRIGQLALKLSF